MTIENKVAIVTGAGRGIGRSIALNLARSGCNIVVADINLDSWKEFGGEQLTASSVEEEVKKIGSDSIGVEVDVSDKVSVKNLMEQTIKKFGKIDILINNAGGLAGKVENSFASIVPEDELKATVERNLYGAIFCCQEVVKYMKEQNYGKIVNFGSQAGLRAQAGGLYASYGAAKAGVILYTKYLAQELGCFNINVNCVAPAYVGTKRLNAIYFDEHREEVTKDICLGRIADPIDIAKVVKFLVSDDANYITGQCISVCGGAINF